MKRFFTLSILIFFVSSTVAQYLDLNEYGLKGDNSDESLQFSNALREASSKGLTLTGKGTFNLNGTRIVVPGNISIEAKKKGELIIRNGAYIFGSGDIQLQKIIFEDFTTSVFYYPKNKEPRGDIKIEVNDCRFEDNMAAFFSQGQSYWMMLRNSKFTCNDFINSGTAAVSLKFNHRNLLFEKNHFEGLMFEGKKLYYLVLAGLDSAGGGRGFQFRKNTIKNIVHPGKDINYTVLARGSNSLFSENDVEDVSDVAFYVRGDSGVVERNRIINKTVASNHAIIAKGGSRKGFIHIRDNEIKGKFGTAIYLDSRYGYAEITGNDIDIKNENDSVLYAGIRVVGHEVYKKFDITGNSIQVKSTNRRAAAIRLNGKGFEQVNITNNKLIKSSSQILLTGKNDIKNLRMTGNRMSSKVASSIAAENIEIEENEVEFPGEIQNAFKMGTVGKVKMGNNKKMKK
ncbi:MAG: right-handed parallel beta-helix repeat-containing protein [Flavitalea sp.]